MAESKGEKALTILVGVPLSLLAIFGLFGSLAFGLIAFVPFVVLMLLWAAISIPYTMWKERRER